MKLVYGVGVNDLGYVVQKKSSTQVDGKRQQKQEWTCPFYRVWVNMMERCHNRKFKQKRPSYEDVVCCDDWLYASKFKVWMGEQDWGGRQLDKDIIVTGNKMYSPETCAFVSPITNSFVLDCKSSRGKWLLGVYWNKAKRKFKAQCCNPFTKKNEHLGYFDNETEAHEAWRKRKHGLAQLVAATESDPRVVGALKKRYSYEEWYKHNPI